MMSSGAGRRQLWHLVNGFAYGPMNMDTPTPAAISSMTGSVVTLIDTSVAAVRSVSPFEARASAQ